MSSRAINQATTHRKLKTMKMLVMLPWLFLFFFVAPVQSQGDLSVELETTPGASQIGPDNTFAKTTLRVVDAAGQTVPNAYLKFHLDAPPDNAFVSTDFPIVENTPLMDYEGVLPDGVLEFDYIYPIRGTYSFVVEAGRDASTLKYEDTLTLQLNENRNEILNFVLFGLILLGLGIAAGFIIGRGARAQRMAATGIALLLGMGLVSGSAFTAQAHDGGNVSSAEAFTEQSTNGNLTLSYSMNPGGGRVGSLNRLTLTATDSSGQLVPDTTFEVAFWHIEDEKPIFATTLFAPAGESNLKFQFFDGAEHEVRLAASNPAGTVGLTRVVEVEGLSPPLPVKIKTTVYLVALVLAGIFIGLRIQAVRAKKLEAMPVGA
jgi:hypothetical protein